MIDLELLLLALVRTPRVFRLDFYGRAVECASNLVGREARDTNIVVPF